MTTPSPEQVREFWAFMTESFDTVVADKESAVEMKVLSVLLARLGITDRDAFLRHYATTIGGCIYLPFEPGEPQTDWSLWDQMVVCVHEHQHVVQCEEMGLLVFGARYLTSRAARARFEAEAYRSSLEMEWWHSRTMPDPNALAERLDGYGVSKTDIAVAAGFLASSAVSIRRGAIVNRATAIALDWLNEHTPELRAPASG